MQNYNVVYVGESKEILDILRIEAQRYGIFGGTLGLSWDNGFRKLRIENNRAYLSGMDSSAIAYSNITTVTRSEMFDIIIKLGKEKMNRMSMDKNTINSVSDLKSGMYIKFANSSTIRLVLMGTEVGNVTTSTNVMVINNSPFPRLSDYYELNSCVNKDLSINTRSSHNLGGIEEIYDHYGQLIWHNTKIESTIVLNSVAFEFSPDGSISHGCEERISYKVICSIHNIARKFKDREAIDSSDLGHCGRNVVFLPSGGIYYKGTNVPFDILKAVADRASEYYHN